MHCELIGMGAGSPGHITLDGVACLQQVDGIIALDKGDTKHDLLAVRETILQTHAPHVPLVTVADPPRDRHPENYEQEVIRWHHARAELLYRTIVQRFGVESRVGFLVWGDPALYDSTLRIIDHMRTVADAEITVTVYPGITAIAALTAAHAIVLNRIGEAIHVTTGRMLPATSKEDRRNCVVMLDGGTAFTEVAGPDTYIYWGAYLGTPQQVLRQGYVADVGEEITALKAQLREEHGWIMDTYLLREIPAS
ncbi:precorrin-6A synthase (deacetylating) [Corynebacterium choanae]|uniref:Precorrin 6A synthase n=1 Tax=Corynebacterium choanae TaxID=1862358 RepID=A0A3G6J525_9CORY|nr:precorrin-6A synthase (deacetylating) [Corynebacterium choanae]AZA13049.1 precorrin 6A synthase [Corynebacterium choanae]